ncbi:MAG TPA: tRNA preQ1(34) S-adenosylmethionine ribosyltransferase-isomerase QueA [Nannocystaceae bacterium]|nr:tRNA preQ1(34) S-adenosylmethionine ribosyltransferase-isomerase QueA [Nannocystaceae bacterium]
MSPDDYDYELPQALIAQHPAPNRGDAKMMVLRDDHVVHTTAQMLAEHVPEGALVVVNASKVVPARTIATRTSDGRTFELLWCAPAAGQGPGARVRAWVRGGRRLRTSDELQLHELRARVTDVGDGRERELEITHGELLPTLQAVGTIPLPPYIEREATAEDRERYQTRYADRDGSIAAPTAGLHLEPELLAKLDVARLRLHVGPGTFLPMDVADVRDHRVGAERIELDDDDAARIEAARSEGRPILAVGTTVVRALETIFAQHGRVRAHHGSTELVITPDHRFGVVTELLTNFHLPKSSLLMLVASFGGHARVMSAYREAVRAGYRFYSYGDCMLVSRSR